MFEKPRCIQFIWGNFSLFLRTEQLYLRDVVGFPHMSCSLQALSYLLWIKTLIWPLKNMNVLQSQLHALTFSFRIHWYDSEVIVPLKWWAALVRMQQTTSKFWYCSHYVSQLYQSSQNGIQDFPFSKNNKLFWPPFVHSLTDYGLVESKLFTNCFETF